MRPRGLLKMYMEKDSHVRKRMWLNILVGRDGMSATGAVIHPNRAPSGASSGAAAISTRERRLRTRSCLERPSHTYVEAMNMIRHKTNVTPC